MLIDDIKDVAIEQTLLVASLDERKRRFAIKDYLHPDFFPTEVLATLENDSRK